MKVTVPAYYKNFKCKASKCNDTCCRGWEIIIDDETLNKYKNVSGDFGEKLKSKIISYDDNETGFKLLDDRCPFLNKDNLCDIYSNIGEDKLCYTCKMFPRVIMDYGLIREISLSLGCEEACRLLLSQKDSISFETTDSSEKDMLYNYNNFELYTEIFACRNVAFNIARDRDIAISDRLVILLIFANDIQEAIDNINVSSIKEIRNQYKAKKYLIDIIRSINYKNDSRYEFIEKCINIFSKLETINKKWEDVFFTMRDKFYSISKDSLENKKNHDKLIKEFLNYNKRNDYKKENLIMYFLFRYFNCSINDCDVLSKVKFLVFSIIMITELEFSRWACNKDLKDNDIEDIVHIYSKEIEHSEDNMKTLYEIFNNDDNFSFSNFINAIKIQ